MDVCTSYVEGDKSILIFFWFGTNLEHDPVLDVFRPYFIGFNQGSACRNPTFFYKLHKCISNFL